MSVLVLLIGVRAAAAVDVTVCEQIVPAGEVGELVADLDCGTNGIVLDHRATLRLNGFVLTGTSGGSPSCSGFDTCAGVRCRGRACQVEGPGEIRGFLFGVNAQGSSDRTFRASVRDVVLAGNQAGFWGDVVRIERAQVVDNVLAGIVSGTRATVKDSQVLRNAGGGISGVNVRARSVTVSDVGPAALTGIHGHRVRLVDVTVNNCMSGGVEATHSLRAVDSTLSGNVPDDVRVFGQPPRLVRTSCLVSSDGVGGTWGVCAND